MTKIFKQRICARSLALQGIYSWLFLNCDINHIENFLILNKNINKLDIIFLREILHGVPQREEILTFILEGCIDKYTNINIIEKIIINIALFEIFFVKKLSFNIIINEALNLSKKFCSKNSYMLINKILSIVVNGYVFNFRLLISS